LVRDNSTVVGGAVPFVLDFQQQESWKNQQTTARMRSQTSYKLSLQCGAAFPGY
jgi:hypothetical protein